MTQTTYFVQQGSSGSLRVCNENAWIIVAETWRGSQIVNTRSVGTYETRSQATVACEQLRKQ